MEYITQILDTTSPERLEWLQQWLKDIRKEVYFNEQEAIIKHLLAEVNKRVSATKEVVSE